MMKKLNIFAVSFACLFGCFFCALAAQDGLQKDNLNKWGFAGSGQGVYWRTCKNFYSQGDETPCIGTSKGNCTAKSVINPSWDDEWGVIMMVARSTTVGGARFCPIMIIGRNHDYEDATWTTYHEASGQCFWLCREGYTGSECTEPVSNTTNVCEVATLSGNYFDNTKAVGNEDHTNIKDFIPNWGADNDKVCLGFGTGSVKEEHDLILAVSKWLPSGHGAMVRPYVVRAARSGFSRMDSWINITPAGLYSGNGDSDLVQPKLACRIGYKPNASKTDCVAIDDFACGSKKMCSGWDRSKYNSGTHEEVNINGCYQWRCKESGYGLDQVGGTSCTSCGSTAMDGVNPQNGTCVHCAKGKVFSEDAKSTGYCANTFYADKTRLLYGSGSQSSKIEAQCWTMDDLTKYKNCVLGR